MRSYPEFYRSLSLPPWAPPEWLFGAAWGVIYPLFIVATAVAIVAVRKRRAPKSLLALLGLNWIANLAFTPVQLGLEPLWPASIVILMVFGTLAAFQWQAWRVLRPAFWLMLPYLVWGAYATVLQLTITIAN